MILECQECSEFERGHARAEIKEAKKRSRPDVLKSL